MQTAKIGGAFDVNSALKEAVKTQIENSFQDYMDQTTKNNISSRWSQ